MLINKGFAENMKKLIQNFSKKILSILLHNALFYGIILIEIVVFK